MPDRVKGLKKALTLNSFHEMSVNAILFYIYYSLQITYKIRDSFSQPSCLLFMSFPFAFAYLDIAECCSE